MIPVLWIVAGLAALVIGAELVVRDGSRLAERLGVPPMIIGLTIVSLGTSAPELAVGIDAMLADAGSLAIGNISGTNIVNIALILGLCTLIRPVEFGRRTLLLDLPGVVVASALLYVLSLNGSLSWPEGIPLVLVGLAYLVLLGWWTRREAARAQPELVETQTAPQVDEGATAADRRPSMPATVLFLVLGLVLIVVGADRLVDGAVDVAGRFGISDAFIGLTVVAIGTSAPELFTAIISTIRGNRDIAIGNLIGSSIFNLTLILGVPVLVTTGSGPIDHELIAVDLPVMVALALLCVPLFLTGKRLSRGEGALLVLGYAVYLGYLILTRT